MGPARELYYPGEPALAEDRVNYRFVNGFVDIGDLPCRKAIWKDISVRTVELEKDFDVIGLNLPGFNRRVEFSGFWHRPTRLSRWLKTKLVAPVSGNYPFKLATCGGVHIWVDGILVARFEPFRRNKESTTEVELPLRAGGSDIVIFTEEMAERDALWYFELTCLGDSELRTILPVPASEDHIQVLKDLATQVRPQPMHLKKGQLVLVFDKPASLDVTIQASVLPSVHMRDKQPLMNEKSVLKAHETRVVIPGADRLPDGYHPLKLSFSIGDTKVQREIAFATLCEEPRDMRNLALETRKKIAVEYMADHGEMRAGRAIAMMAAGRPVDPVFREIISNTLAAINERRDCSDFVLVPLLWLTGCYRERIPSDLLEAIDRSILGYRYWVDEPGNDVMWFWSENHVLCFHAAQYLAGRQYAGAVFATSGRTGQEQARLGEERLMKWFDSVEQHGLAEWNSAAYYPIDFIGLLALQHLGDGEIRRRSEQLLDRLFVMIGLHKSGGVPAGTMGRAYDKELRAGPLTELAPFATVGFGLGWLNDGVAALPMFASGGYSPPGEALRAAFVEPGMAISAHYVQGHDHAAKLALYKTSQVQLSSMVGGQPGGRGHQQHVVDVRFTANELARAWVNHPGEDDPWGNQRPSYWAGNGSLPRTGQHEDTALLLFDLGDNARINFTHAYVESTAFDDVLLKDNWIIIRKDSGYAAMTATQAISKIEDGPGANIEYRAPGRHCGWMIIVGEGRDNTSFEAFQTHLATIRLQVSDDGKSLTASRSGKPTLTLDWNDGLALNGTSHPFPNLTLQPLIKTFVADTY
ncbi:hypothetical protein FE840_002235 [Peteryoungia desertarenae]|uniref:Uncharacterized protein n=1 Tax=Peteryoungia desertarenae TaxID=1813451 RepID=A0ABX6QSR1_9HYPH|nr:hypothetical protein FE840_002235 [Peteryoungia desertarenae]